MLNSSSEIDDYINELVYGHKIDFPKIITLFLLIKEKGPIGRYKIVKELEIPEGIARGALSYLTNLGFFHKTKKGTVLTETGSSILSMIFKKTGIKSIKNFNFDFMALDSCCAVAQLSHRKSLNVLTLRDKAVRAGASAFMLISYERDRFVIPKVYKDISTVFPPLAEKLSKEFSLTDGDLLASAFARNAWKASYALISVAINDYTYLITSSNKRKFL
ncbi:MAG: DUF4443 domain-containing protein [Nitrososphaerales archaeon]